ncbi:hypothetical protein HHI36_021704 [Cryptolaemus montrouzieri]|uniref:Uncharacterized protein n=1 Tax=Cryptolaemus montrouzieri TaxID=559131 RepID=A0ABD2MXN1_9CUCU
MSANQKNVWKDLRKLNILSKSKDSYDIPAELTDLNRMNRHFVESANIVGPPKEELIIYYLETQRLNVRSFSFRLCTEDDVRRAIGSVKTSASGRDDLYSHIILTVLYYGEFPVWCRYPKVYILGILTISGQLTSCLLC